MNIRTRKLIGTFGLLALMIVYALLAAGVAVVLQVNQAGRVAELAYYVVAGMAWTIPAGALIWWMGRPDKSRPDRAS